MLVWLLYIYIPQITRDNLRLNLKSIADYKPFIWENGGIVVMRSTLYHCGKFNAMTQYFTNIYIYMAIWVRY